MAAKLTEGWYSGDDGQRRYWNGFEWSDFKVDVGSSAESGPTVEAELVEEDAERAIATAVGARHSIARKYVMRLRRRHPEAPPADLIRMLERHYGASITTAGAIISAGAIAADIGIAMIPVAGAAAAGAKSASQQAAKKAGTEAAKAVVKSAAKEATKTAGKNIAVNVGRLGAQRVPLPLWTLARMISTPLTYSSYAP